MSDLEVSVECGNCGGNLFMATCDNFRGTGHEWVLVGVCMVCRSVHWTDEGCVDCASNERQHEQIIPIFDADLNLIKREDQS